MPMWRYYDGVDNLKTFSLAWNATLLLTLKRLQLQGDMPGAIILACPAPADIKYTRKKFAEVDEKNINISV